MRSHGTERSTPSSTRIGGVDPDGWRPTPFAGSVFRTNIPAGWQDQTTNQSAVASVSGGGTVLMLLASPDHGIIVASTTPQPVADDQLAQYLASIAPPGATQIEPGGARRRRRRLGRDGHIRGCPGHRRDGRRTRRWWSTRRATRTRSSLDLRPGRISAQRRGRSPGDPRQLVVGLTAASRRIRRCWCS